MNKVRKFGWFPVMYALDECGFDLPTIADWLHVVHYHLLVGKPITVYGYRFEPVGNDEFRVYKVKEQENG